MLYDLISKAFAFDHSRFQLLQAELLELLSNLRRIYLFIINFPRLDLLTLAIVGNCCPGVQKKNLNRIVPDFKFLIKEIKI